MGDRVGIGRAITLQGEDKEEWTQVEHVASRRITSGVTYIAMPRGTRSANCIRVAKSCDTSVVYPGPTVSVRAIVDLPRSGLATIPPHRPPLLRPGTLPIVVPSPIPGMLPQTVAEPAGPNRATPCRQK